MSDCPTPDQQPDDAVASLPPTHQAYAADAPAGSYGSHGDYQHQPALYAAADWTQPVSRPGKAAYVVALVAGIPVALLMLLWTLGSVLDGALPGLLVLGLGGASATGTVFAVQDLRTGSRGRRTAALLLTLIPAGLVAVMIGFLMLMVVLVLGGGNPH